MKLTHVLRWITLWRTEGRTSIKSIGSVDTSSVWFYPDPWNQVSKSRLALASISSGALLVGAVVTGVTLTHHAKSWTKVYSSGSYVGLVPNRRSVLNAISRVAIGYHVNVSFAPVHTVAPRGYNWDTVASLPMQATAIQVAGKTLAYIATHDEATQVLNDVKSALLPKTVAKGADITFAQPVKLVSATVGVASVWSEATAVEHILHPNITAPSGRAVGLEAIVSTSLTKPTAHRINLPKLSSSSQNGSKVNNTNAASASEPAAFSLSSGVINPGAASEGSTPLVSLKVSETVAKTVKFAPPVHYINDSSLASGQDKVLKSGKPGVADERVHLEFINGALQQSTVVSRRVVASPVTEVVDKGTNNGIASGTWIWPSPYTDITSPFGWRILFGAPNYHPGVDIGCPIGTPIYATNDGVVEQAGWNNGGYGNWVLLNNGNGIQTVFGHMTKVAVSAGQTVHKGEVIGYSGETGFATGPHLHYEVRVNGTAVNPAPYM